MASETNLKVASPNDIRPNPENPRLIFREKELNELEESISTNGILVPLTVFESSSKGFVLLDGERRWRCAKKLGLRRVPIIVQPEPSQIANIMMMFAIHNARSDWDPFPTAKKLQELEQLYERNEGHLPTESQLAQLASLSRGEVRRLKNILGLPDEYLKIIEKEEELPRADQTLTVDHLLEVTRGAKALTREGILDQDEQHSLERTLIQKFQTNTLNSTVEPRLLTRMARAVERQDVPIGIVQHSVKRLIEDPTFTVQDAYQDSVERAEQEHSLELAARRLTSNINDFIQNGDLSASTLEALEELYSTLNVLFGN